MKKEGVLEMKYRTRIYYSEEQKSQMWDRWQKGESLHSIARLFDRGHSSISRILSITGGIRPQKRTRSSLTLTLSEREDISRGIATRVSIRAIAAKLKRSLSTVSREIIRNGGYYNYRATSAEQAAWDRALRPKPCRLMSNKTLSRKVAKKLQLQ
ncbi:MAG: helix-turn-helix domain-containing protein, partial [Gammaproteobacteria bacterium]|nr:helix-turn-helix domain-containing protein [Gammaproteobacteria bacterium]